MDVFIRELLEGGCGCAEAGRTAKQGGFSSVTTKTTTDRVHLSIAICEVYCSNPNELHSNARRKESEPASIRERGQPEPAPPAGRQRQTAKGSTKPKCQIHRSVLHAPAVISVSWKVEYLLELLLAGIQHVCPDWNRYI